MGAVGHAERGWRAEAGFVGCWQNSSSPIRLSSVTFGQDHGCPGFTALFVYPWLVLAPKCHHGHPEMNMLCVCRVPLGAKKLLIKGFSLL